MTNQQLNDLLVLLNNQPSTWLTADDDYDHGYATGWNDALDAIKTYLTNASNPT